MLVWRPETEWHRLRRAPSLEKYLHGWFGHGNRRVLDDVLTGKKPRTVIELGTWYGKSADYLMRHDSAPERLFCVDLWSAQDILEGQQVIRPHHTVRHQGTQTPVSEVMAQHPLWETTMANLWPYRDRLVALQTDSLSGLRIIADFLEEREELETVDLIYIDADHRYQAVCDEIILATALFPGAQLVGDDYTAHRPVRRAVDHMALQLGVDVVTDHNCWYYQRKK